MNKPQPKRKIVVRKTIDILYISCVSDMKQWVETEAATLGYLVKELASAEHILRLNKCWDVGEVAAYLEAGPTGEEAA